MKTQIQIRSVATLAAGILVGGVVASGPVAAQTKPVPSGSVLIFPAVVEGVEGDSARLVSEVVTDALRSRLKTLGTSVVIYSPKLSSIQRAREEQQIRKEDVEAGPLDDRRKAQRMAEIVGASEYISVFVDGYTFKSDSRSASFNLNINRYLTTDGSPVGTFTKAQAGMSPAGVAVPRQEGSAIARAMEIGGEQGIGELYPAATILENAKAAPKKSKASSGGLVKLFVAGLAALYQSTR
ncbi:MAG: hypothetical protein ACOVT5_02555 [Armatimonadaceae bacterium]